MPVEQPEPPANLRQRLMQFTLSEVEAFCHDLGINRELLRRQKLDELVLDLLGHCQRRPGFIERLTQLVEQAEEKRAIPSAEGECPYKGLQAYEEVDAHLFFGREKLTQELVEHLQKQNFLAVVGASGSGKSSVVKAGVIPQLRKDSEWLIVPPFRPGLDPFEQLALQLLPFVDPTLTPTSRLIEQTKLSQAFVEGTLSLSKVISQILQNHPGRGRLLLVVDQFEELFTHHQDKQSQEQWLSFITEPLTQALNQLTLLLTLRADFYGYATQSATLKPLLQTQQVIVPLMAPAELEEAITQPAAQAWQFQDGLVATILEDVAQEPGGLPFLSQALLKTWEKRQGRQLTLAGYLASGGVKEAISQTAETVYEELTGIQQKITKRVFLRLTKLGEGKENTRRRLPRTELMGLPYSPKLMQEVLNKLTAPQVRLLTQDHEHLEVSHEALIRGWPRLKDWLNEDREGEQLRGKLTEATLEWERLGRDKSLLWPKVRLAQMEEWIKNKTDLARQEGEFLTDLTFQEQAFLEQSKAEEERIAKEREILRQKELEAAKQLAEARENRLRVIRSALSGAILLMVVAFIGFWVAVNFYYEADQNFSLASTREIEAFNAQETALADRAIAQVEATKSDQNLATAVYNEQIAKEQANRSLASALASASQISGNEKAMQSLLLGIEAIKISPSYLAFTALNDRLIYISKPIFIFTHEDTVNSTQWNEDETRILTASEDGTARVWDGKTSQLLFTIAHKGAVTFAQWNKDESRILTTSEDGTAKVWNGQTGDLLLTLTHDGALWSTQWNKDENRILTTSEDGTAKVWNSQTGDLLLTLTHDGVVWSAQWNKDESRILTTSEDGTAKVWNGQTGDLLLTLTHDGVVWSAQWNKDESRILTTGEYETAKIWNSKTGELLLTITHQIIHASAQWDKDETRILTHGGNRKAMIWDGQTGQLLFTMTHKAGVTSAQWNEDGSRVLTTSEDGTAKVWNGQTGELLLTLTHDGAVWSAQWNKAGSRIITVGKNGMVRVWDGQTGELLLTLTHDGVNSVQMNEAETYILTTSYDGTARMWNIMKTDQFFLPQTDEIIIRSATWNETETKILTSSWDGTAKVWNGQTGEILITLTHKGGVNSAKWNKTETKILTSSWDGTAKVWNGQTGDLLLTLAHDGAVWSAQWSKDENRILTTSEDGTAKVWYGKTGELLLTLNHGGNVHTANWNGDETHILTASIDNKMAKIWDGMSGELLVSLRHEGGVGSVQWNGDGFLILTASNDGTVKTWNGLTGELLFTIYHESVVRSAQKNKRGDRILTASDDGMANVWDGEDGKLLLSLHHDNKVYSALWNSLETKILTTDEKGVARLWDVATGELLLTMEGDGSVIVSAEWSDQDSRLWIFTANGLVRTYYTDQEELIAEACGRATRNLTWVEWQIYLPGRPYRQTCPNLPVHESVPEEEVP